RASSRRRRNGTEEPGDFGDEEDESLERKLARLRREVEEVREEVARRQAQKSAGPPAGAGESVLGMNRIAALSDVLSGLQMSKNGTTAGAQAELAQKIGASVRIEGAASPEQTRKPPAPTQEVCFILCTLRERLV